jgi:hypothetical protein
LCNFTWLYAPGSLNFLIKLDILYFNCQAQLTSQWTYHMLF